jgi:hypothetical protein
VKNMSALWKNQFSSRKIASVAVIATFLFVGSAIDLLHVHEQGHLCGGGHADTRTVLCCDDMCPAQMFLSVSHSTQVSSGPALSIPESRIVFQPLPDSTVVRHDELAWSIILRAPPGASIS